MQLILGNNTIPSSRKRVISIWFGNANRVDLKQNDDFTGSVVLATIFTIQGYYQYFLIFYSLSHKVVEIWKTDPENVPISEAPSFEKFLFSHISSMGLELMPLPSDNKDFHAILMNLPMAYDDDDNTAHGSQFPFGATDTSFSLTDKEKAMFKALFIQL